MALEFVNHCKEEIYIFLINLSEFIIMSLPRTKFIRNGDMTHLCETRISGAQRNGSSNRNVGHLYVDSLREDVEEICSDEILNNLF